MWNPQIRRCLRPDTYLDGLRWWQWFEYCEDEYGFCKTNGKTHTSFAQGQLTKQIEDEQDVVLTISRTEGYREIPENYFCKWNIPIDKEAEYNLQIRRDFYENKEQLELNIIGDNKQ